MPIPDDTYFVMVDHDWLTAAALALASAKPAVVTVVDFTRAPNWTPCSRCGLSFDRHTAPGRPRTLCYECSPRTGRAPLPSADYSMVAELSNTRAALEYVKRQLRMGRPKREILAVIEAV